MVANPGNLADSSVAPDTDSDDGPGGMGMGASAIRGTIMPGGALTRTLRPGGTLQSDDAPVSAIEFDRAVIDDYRERMIHLCNLLKRKRQPQCSINGAMILLPWQIVANPIAADKLVDAVRNDLWTMQAATQLRFPVLTYVSGMENEPGFMELVRRVGMSVAKDSRFGKGFDVQNLSSAENMDALSSQACAAFENWVYDRFQKKEALGKHQGNGKLYSMLCKVSHSDPRTTTSRSRKRASIRRSEYHG